MSRPKPDAAVSVRLVIAFLGVWASSTLEVRAAQGPARPAGGSGRADQDLAASEDGPLKIGALAPAIVADAWLNLDGREGPSPASLRDKVVLVEFWGTWDFPSVRAMAHVQELHERYAKHGVVVLAVANETAETIRPFLEGHHYTMPAGADRGLRTHNAYRVKSWPSTVLIDRLGNLAWQGGPYGVEEALDKLLQLPSRPGALLDAYVAARSGGGEEAQREMLGRLVRKSPTEFDLKSWAAGHEPASAPAEAAPADGGPGDALERYAGGEAAAGRTLARGDATAFDLARWARQTLGRRFPVRVDELGRLLAKRRHGDAVDALADRRPSPEGLALALTDKPFVEFCRTQAAGQRDLARKGLLALWWVLAPPALAANAFNDLGVNALRYATPLPMGADGKVDYQKASLAGVSFSGAMLTTDEAPAFVEWHLSRHAVMNAVASDNGAEVAPERVNERVSEEWQAILAELRAKYGLEPPRP